MENLKFLVRAALFVTKLNETKIEYSLNFGNSSSDIERLTTSAYPKEKPEILFQFLAKRNETIETQITCEGPHQFQPQVPSSITVDDVIAHRSVTRSLQLQSDVEEKQSIPLLLEVTSSGRTAAKFNGVFHKGESTKAESTSEHLTSTSTMTLTRIHTGVAIEFRELRDKEELAKTGSTSEQAKAGTSQTGTDKEGVAAAKFGEQSDESPSAKDEIPETRSKIDPVEADPATTKDVATKFRDLTDKKESTKAERTSEHVTAWTGLTSTYKGGATQFWEPSDKKESTKAERTSEHATAWTSLTSTFKGGATQFGEPSDKEELAKAGSTSEQAKAGTSQTGTDEEGVAAAKFGGQSDESASAKDEIPETRSKIDPVEADPVTTKDVATKFRDLTALKKSAKAEVKMSGNVTAGTSSTSTFKGGATQFGGPSGVMTDHVKADTSLADTDEEGSIIRLGERTGGRIAISKSIRRIIGLERKRLVVGGCAATFPRDSFSKETPVGVTAEIDSSKWPRNFFGFTPTLYVDAEGLQKEVDVALPSWCVTSNQRIGQIRVLHRPKGGDKWEDTNIILYFTDKNLLQFKWKNFSPVLGGVWGDISSALSTVWPSSSSDETPAKSEEESYAKPRIYRVAGSIFSSDFNEVSIAYHLNTPLAQTDVISRMDLGRHPKGYITYLNPFTTEVNGKVKSTVNCIEPDDLQFRPMPKDCTITVDDDFGNGFWPAHQFIIKGNSEQEQMIGLECKVLKEQQTESLLSGPHAFTHTWKPKTRGATEQQVPQEPSVSVPVNVNVNVKQQGPSIDNSHPDVVAGTYANQGAHLELAQKDVRNVVASSGASGAQNRPN